MFAKISRLFIYASLLSPLVVVRASFFPFIAEKAIIFRILIELALLFFLLHALIEFGHSPQGKQELLVYLKTKLKNPIILAAGVFGVIFLLAAFVGVNPTQSIWSNFERGDGAFQVLHYIIFFALTILLFPTKKTMRSLLLTNIAASVLMCGYAIAQLMSTSAVNSGFILAASNRVSGTLGNPSYLAAYLLINLAIILYFFLERKETWWRFAFGALFIFEGYVLLNTGTRAAFLGLILGLIVVCAINLSIGKNQKFKLWLSIGLAITIGLPILFFLTHNAAFWRHVPVLNRLINYESAVTDIQPRLWTWNTALSAVKDRPLLGYGAENFPYPFDKYYNANHYGIESFFDRAHNIFLEYLITGGIALLLAWLAIFYFYYRQLLRRPKNFWWSILFVVPIMYVCQASFLFDTLPIYIMLFLFLALFISDHAPEIELPMHNSKIRMNVPLLITGLVIIGATGTSLYYTSYRPMRKNYLLTQALILQNTFTAELQQGAKNITATPAQIIPAYLQALKFNSPVGQEETIGMFQKFAIFVIDILSRNAEVVKNPEYVKEIRSLVEQTNLWFDQNRDLFVGIKESYLNGGINLRAGIAFNQPDLVARGKQLYQEALVAGPNRLEIIKVLIEVARIEKDQATFETLVSKAEQLRPDIAWR